LPAGDGDKVELDVLMLNEDGRVSVADPTSAGAKVIAEVVGQGRSPKVTVFKYKAKTRYRRKTGHRQDYTRLAIKEILPAGSQKTTAKKTAAKPRSRKRSAEAKAEAEPTGQ
jgi:large subunit ribosomal protein L21